MTHLFGAQGRLLALALLAFAPAFATTRNVTCSGDISTAVQNAINASLDGDTVNITSGSCSTTGWSWTNKNITIQGQGKGVTTLAVSGVIQVNISDTTKASFRITGMTWNAASPRAGLLFIDSENCTAYSYGWRVDHIAMNASASLPNDPVVIWGVTFGVLDHNDFKLANATWIIASFFQTGLGELTWGSPTVTQVGGWYNLSLPSQYNSTRAIYFEDNTFTASTSYNAFFDSSSGGARVVFRHNTFTGGFLYDHWVRQNDLDIFQWEVYNNKFVGSASWGVGNSGMYPVRFESGTGVFYNNTLSGYDSVNLGWAVDDRRAEGGESGGQFGTCNGTHPWDGNLGDSAAPGWPCLGQAGRDYGRTYAQITSGLKQNSLPAYAWNNGTQDACYNPSAGGSACADTIHIFDYFKGPYIKATTHPNGQVDFVNSGTAAMPGYTALAYPHPLVTGATGSGGATAPPPPAPPTGLTAVVH